MPRLELGRQNDCVPLMDLTAEVDKNRRGYHIVKDAGTFDIPDEATLITIGAERTYFPEDDTDRILKVKAEQVMPDGSLHPLCSFATHGGPKELPTKQLVGDAWWTTDLLPGKGRQVKVTYIPIKDVKSSIAVRVL